MVILSSRRGLPIPLLERKPMGEGYLRRSATSILDIIQKLWENTC